MRVFDGLDRLGPLVEAARLTLQACSDGLASLLGLPPPSLSSSLSRTALPRSTGARLVLRRVTL